MCVRTWVRTETVCRHPSANRLNSDRKKRKRFEWWRIGKRVFPCKWIHSTHTFADREKMFRAKFITNSCFSCVTALVPLSCLYTFAQIVSGAKTFRRHGIRCIAECDLCFLSFTWNPCSHQYCRWGRGRRTSIQCMLATNWNKLARVDRAWARKFLSVVQ